MGSRAVDMFGESKELSIILLIRGGGSHSLCWDDHGFFLVGFGVFLRFETQFKHALK